MAKTQAKTTKSRGRAAKKENRIVAYLRSTRAELRKVHWPTREQAWNLTKIVFVVTLGMATLLGLIMDNILTIALRQLIAGNVVAIIITGVVIVGGVTAAVVFGRQAAR